MNEFIGKWRQFIVGKDRLNEGYEIGDFVTFSYWTKEEQDAMEVIARRRMFGTDLVAYTVEKKDGTTAEYDETQLVKIGGIDDRATRVDKMMADEFEDEYLDDKDHPMYDDLKEDGYSPLIHRVWNEGGGDENCENCHDMELYPDEACPECGRESVDEGVSKNDKVLDEVIKPKGRKKKLKSTK